MLLLGYRVIRGQVGSVGQTVSVGRHIVPAAWGLIPVLPGVNLDHTPCPTHGEGRSAVVQTCLHTENSKRIAFL